MRIALEIDQQVYDFYKAQNFPITLGFDVVNGAIMIYDTDTQEWTWSGMPDDISGKDLGITSEDLALDLLYRAPAVLKES